MSRIYAIGTMDTKGEELAWVAECIRQAGADVICVDVGTNGPPTVSPDVPRDQVLASAESLCDQDRGGAVTEMANALQTWLLGEHASGHVAGVIGIGGSGGTALVTQAMRALPVGLPKLVVSTMASGNTAPYVDCSDITLMYSVVDVAGLNSVSRPVLANAAHAMAGMVRQAVPSTADRATLAMTMFGVTTPCVDEVRRQLGEQDYECLVFHATGTGGRAMEKLVASGMISGVLDLTTTEVADEVVGGVLTAGPERFDALIESRVPLVLSTGALDMVNFGAPDTVPVEFADRLFYHHNPQVTLMRTTPDENRACARWIGEKLNRATSPVVLLLPEKGVSMLDADGQPFHNPQTDRILFEELESTIQQDEIRSVRRIPHHINDPEFATAAVDAFNEITR